MSIEAKGLQPKLTDFTRREFAPFVLDNPPIAAITHLIRKIGYVLKQEIPKDGLGADDSVTPITLGGSAAHVLTPGMIDMREYHKTKQKIAKLSEQLDIPQNNEKSLLDKAIEACAASDLDLDLYLHWKGLNFTDLDKKLQKVVGNWNTEKYDGYHPVTELRFIGEKELAIPVLTIRLLDSHGKSTFHIDIAQVPRNDDEANRNRRQRVGGHQGVQRPGRFDKHGNIVLAPDRRLENAPKIGEPVELVPKFPEDSEWETAVREIRQTISILVSQRGNTTNARIEDVLGPGTLGRIRTAVPKALAAYKNVGEFRQILFLREYLVALAYNIPWTQEIYGQLGLRPKEGEKDHPLFPIIGIVGLLNELGGDN